MATVTKDFRVKHGLVVEGTNATVNGSDIITEDAITGGTQTNITVTYNPTTKVVDFVSENGVADSTTDDLVEGEDNLYFTDTRAVDAVETAATSTNTANKIVQRDENGDFVAENITLENRLTADGVTAGAFVLPQLSAGPSGEFAVISGSPGSTFDSVPTVNAYRITLGDSGNLFARKTADGSGDTEVRLDILKDGEGNSNVYLGTNSTESNLVATHGHIDSLIGDETVDGTSGDTVTDRIATAVTDHNDLTTGVHGVTGDVVGTTDSQTLSNKTLGTDLNAGTYKVTNLATPTAEADAATKNYVDSAISNLVDGAPALLDTLNELAAALGDDENFAATVATDIGTKVSKAGDSMTGELSMGTNKITDLGTPTDDYDAATKKYTDDTFVTLEDLPGQLDDYIPLTQKGEADGVATLDEDGQVPVTQLAHVTEAIDGLSTSDIEEGTNLYFTDVRAVDALEAVVPDFTAVEINSIAKQVAATTSAFATYAGVVYSFAKADYRSAKFLVKIQSGTHTELSEVLLTLDTSDNIAITEYAIVGTNGSMGTITADIDGSNVRLIVTPVNDSNMSVVGTLLA
jgi:hypothetical protein